MISTRVAVPKLWFLRNWLCCRDVGRTLVARCQHNFNSGTLATGKTRMAPKPSKTTTAWWLASHLTDVPLFMKCQINIQKSKASPTQTWIALGKLLTAYNFGASLFCTALSLFRTILDPASWWLSQSCDSYAAAFGGSQVKQNYRSWWLASNLTDVPLFMKCQINNQKSKASPTQTWIALGKLLTAYNFGASLFCTALSLFRTILDPA